jgi:glycerol dehydrogenase
MAEQSGYSHSDKFGNDTPRVLFSPPKYIQGPSVLKNLGKYLSFATPRTVASVAIIITDSGRSRIEKVLCEALKGFEVVYLHFGGECSYDEADRLAHMLSARSIDVLIGIGGGKLLDCGKLVASKENIPFVSFPTVASNDSPCSALSIMYTPEHCYCGGVVYPFSPALVAVDTTIIAHAPVKYLIAGFGDAMATYYEAKTCFDNNKLSMLNAKPTLTAIALAKLCADTLYEHGVQAMNDCQNHVCSNALEAAVEANTLLSGIGFESGGLAAAHGIAQALTVLPHVEENFAHGEMVAVGLVTMLVLEGNEAEARRVMNFFAQVGLPYSYQHLSVDLEDIDAVSKVTSTAVAQWFTHNEPFPVEHDNLLASMKGVERLAVDINTGAEVTASI